MKYWFRNIMRRLEREPEAPVNVRLTWPNGQTVPIECVPDNTRSLLDCPECLNYQMIVFPDCLDYHMGVVRHGVEVDACSG